MAGGAAGGSEDNGPITDEADSCLCAADSNGGDNWDGAIVDAADGPTSRGGTAVGDGSMGGDGSIRGDVGNE